MKKVLLVVLAAFVVPWQVAHSEPSFAATATLTLSAPVVPPGGSVTVYGKNFPAGAACTLNINTQPVGLTSTTPQADSTGSFSISLTIPSNTQQGSYSVTAGCSGATAQAVTLSVATPQVTFTPSSVAAGNPVTVSGKGFAGNMDLSVAVTLNISGGGTSPFSQVIHTATDGSFSGLTINVPGTAINGSYPVQFSQGGANVLTANLIVGQATTLSLSPSNIAAGAYTTFQVSGTNFLVGERVDVAYTQNQANGTTQIITGSGTADTSGSISHVLLYVPSNTVPGTYTVTATGANSHRVATAQLVVRPAATLSITPTAVPAGATVAVNGQNFPAGAIVTLVSAISQKDGSVANQTVTASADGNGAFSTPFSIPAGTASGPVHIVATAPGPQSTQLTASADVSVTLLRPNLQVTPSAVTPGSVVAVTATGFLPGAAVTVSTQVTANGAQQSLSQTVPADAAGVAQAFLTIPAGSASGTATVTATQPAGAASASANLTIQAPTPVATPTASPTPSPTATNTPTPSPTTTPALAFASVRTLHHVIRGGQMNQVDAQANQTQVLTIWAHINYPNGRHIDYNSKTDSSGHWRKQFRVLPGTTNQYARRVYIHLQLWRGKETVKTFGSFLIKS